MAGVPSTSSSPGRASSSPSAASGASWSRRGRRVVVGAPGPFNGDGTSTSSPPSEPARVGSSRLNMARSWTELATVAPTAADVTLRRFIKANRLDKLVKGQAQAFRAAPEQLTSLGSAAVLGGMLTYGHGLLTQLGGLARLMEGELDAVALFLMLFHVVSAVTARPSQDE